MAAGTQPSMIQRFLENEAMISSDSHVIEPSDLWTKLPSSIQQKLPTFGERKGDKPGGKNPKQRLDEMAKDCVSAEVLYPTRGLQLFGIEDAAAQEAAFQIGNDYMAEYCSAAPGRLVGIAMISCYNIKNSVKELERSKAIGLKGALIWAVPPEHLRFTTQHYDELWAAAQDLNMPVNLHILSGFNYSRTPQTERSGIEAYRNSINTKLNDAITTLFDLIFSGVMERFPKLKFVQVENEIGWIPFLRHQWDRYVLRFAGSRSIAIHELPSVYLDRQVYSTFFNDPPGAHLLSFWGVNNCMWSNDYPHGNSTWPKSHEIIVRDLNRLSEEDLRKVLQGNVARLYDFPVPRRIDRTPTISESEQRVSG